MSIAAALHDALLQVADPQERRELMKQFAAERESAKARILEVGNQLLTLSKPGTSTGGVVTLDAGAEPVVSTS